LTYHTYYNYYLSGAISKQPNFKEYFKRYEDELNHWGVISIFNPAATDWPEDVKWEKCLKYNLKFLMDSDCLVLLPNWKRSRGAKLEIYVAKALGIRVVKFNDLVRELMKNAS
jgi:hypothetical protein